MNARPRIDFFLAISLFLLLAGGVMVVTHGYGLVTTPPELRDPTTWEYGSYGRNLSLTQTGFGVMILGLAVAVLGGVGMPRR